MKTYLDQYQQQIEPKLHAIDLFIKTNPPPYSLSETARLLHLSEQEVEKIMQEENFDSICQHNFFTIMQKGSSPICQIFARELKCGTPRVYSVEHISYIYNLNIFDVIDAAKKMGVSTFTTSMTKHLFQLIPPHQP